MYTNIAGMLTFAFALCKAVCYILIKENCPQGLHCHSVCISWTRSPEREVGGSKPTAPVLCPWARHFTPLKYRLITQEAVAPSRHDWKIVDWDVKPQHKQNFLNAFLYGKATFFEF